MQCKAYWFGSFRPQSRATDLAAVRGHPGSKIHFSASHRSFADPRRVKMLAKIGDLRGGGARGTGGRSNRRTVRVVAAACVSAVAVVSVAA